MAFACRVSNPDNQDNDEFKRLLSSCVKRNEWSVLESSCMILEFNTTRAISPQVLRHRSYTFQEFSQRWQATLLMERCPMPEIRRQGPEKHDSLHDPELHDKWAPRAKGVLNDTVTLYNDMIADGVHPECARNFLTICTPTRLYVVGNMRSWWHYILLRTLPDTQLEHRNLAWQSLGCLMDAFPVVGELLQEAMRRRGAEVAPSS